LDENFGVAEWTDAKPLKPDTDCQGDQLAGCPYAPLDAACHFVVNSNNQTATFAVGMNKKPLVTGWKSISSSESHSCGIALDDQVYCWGSNTSGALGDGTSRNSSIPVAVDTSGVLSGKTATKLAVGTFHSCVIASDNQVYCWGSGNAGQLGNFSYKDNYAPVAVDTSGVLSGKAIIDISAGLYHTCAVTSENLVYSWGDGFNGQLGNGSNNDSPVPVAVDTSGVLSGKNVSAIAAGETHTCVIANSLMYCWGRKL
jgi:alpha-tubulin suppressor-like RCC1 family protein